MRDVEEKGGFYVSEQEVQIIDFEEMLRFIESRLASAGMLVKRDAIITILQAEEAFLMEKGVLQEYSE
ncbi:hypothetical protein [Brevibacillus reuszeri]|uniref:Uncharacterized protein n=1 Tax=Brevibacillus reuszeri TaxID=54915 RepID=A0A0K9YNC5_9BACL|nr:hypothetical protein [Brevibacillus reuszeri]KNB70243.1 hypothetical protein ADS79_14855 [Brevibacillus reuszeri]MED1859201.1 hypothetical protein [Brevibacillus reuszeri]